MECADASTRPDNLNMSLCLEGSSQAYRLHCQTLVRSVLQLFQNTAAALPAELGPDGTYEVKQRRRQFRMLNPTRAALAWHKRLTAQKQRAEVGLWVRCDCCFAGGSPGSLVGVLPHRYMLQVASKQTGAGCGKKHTRLVALCPPQHAHDGGTAHVSSKHACIFD